MKNKSLFLGALGIFFYVGAEVAIGSYLVNYFIDMEIQIIIQSKEWMKNIANKLLNTNIEMVDKKAVLGSFVTFYWSGAMIGRFIGSYLTKKYRPEKVLSFFTVSVLILITVSMNSTGLIAMWSILAVGLFNSIMFPTIFTLSIKDCNEYTPQASGILCTMIVGGAIIPPLYGFFTDIAGFKIAMTLLLICYGYIYYFSKKVVKK